MILEVLYIDTQVKDRVTIPGNKCVIGRATSATYQIALDCMSRQHLEIEFIDKDFFVTDLNSTNGVYVNGERLPAGVKTIFKNFFPIEIASKVSIFVYPDEAEMPESEQRSSGVAPVAIDDQTATKLRITKPRPALMESKLEKKSGQPVSLKLVGFLVVIAAATYFLMSQDKPQELNNPAVEKAAELRPKVQFVIDDLKSIQGKESSFEDKELASKLKLSNTFEKVVADQDKLFVFVNIEAQLKAINSSYLTSYPEKEQKEYILSSFVFHPLTVASAKERGLKNIVAVGVTGIDDLLKVQASLAAQLSTMVELDQESYERLYSNLFHGGIHRPYKANLQELTTFSTY